MPVSVATLTNFCTTRLVQIQGGLANPTVIAATVCQNLKTHGFGAPNQQELATLLDLWRQILQAANAPAAVISAVELIEFRNEFPWVCLFANVDPLLLALQLAVRAYRPVDIDQSDIDFCGQASLLYTYARDDPEHYVSMVIDMITTGVGRFRDALLEPAPQVLTGLPGNLMVVDWVPLATMRNALDVSHVPGVLSAALMGTQPPLLVALMRRMGYRNVTDRISHRNVLSRMKPRSFDAEDAMKLSRLVKKIDADGSVLRSNRTAFEHEDVAKYMAKFKLLQEAQIKLGQGHLVILAINPDFLQQPNGTAFPATLDEEQYLHYVAAQSIQVNQQSVTLRVFSWGAIYQRTISIRNLMPRFEGYISGQP